MPFVAIEKNAEKLLGLSVEDIRRFSPGELRCYLEKKDKRKISFTTEFPLIGRGNVLRDSIITSEEIDRDIDKILANEGKVIDSDIAMARLRENKENLSDGRSPERIAEIKTFKNTNFLDCPILTEEKLKKMQPRYPEKMKINLNALEQSTNKRKPTMDLRDC